MWKQSKTGSIFLYPQQEPEGGSCQPGTAENTGAMTTSHQPQDRYWVAKGCGGRGGCREGSWSGNLGRVSRVRVGGRYSIGDLRVPQD